MSANKATFRHTAVVFCSVFAVSFLASRTLMLSRITPSNVTAQVGEFRSGEAMLNTLVANSPYLQLQNREHVNNTGDQWRYNVTLTYGDNEYSGVILGLFQSQSPNSTYASTVYIRIMADGQEWNVSGSQSYRSAYDRMNQLFNITIKNALAPEEQESKDTPSAPPGGGLNLPANQLLSPDNNGANYTIIDTVRQQLVSKGFTAIDMSGDRSPNSYPAEMYRFEKLIESPRYGPVWLDVQVSAVDSDRPSEQVTKLDTEFDRFIAIVSLTTPENRDPPFSSPTALAFTKHTVLVSLKRGLGLNDDWIEAKGSFSHNRGGANKTYSETVKQDGGALNSGYYQQEQQTYTDEMNTQLVDAFERVVPQYFRGDVAGVSSTDLPDGMLGGESGGSTGGDDHPIDECPIPSCAQPEPGCRYEPSEEKNDNGCPRFPCGKLMCDDAESGDADGGGDDTHSGSVGGDIGSMQCVQCAPLPPNCVYRNQIEVNGCILQCGSMVCEDQYADGGAQGGNGASSCEGGLLPGEVRPADDGCNQCFCQPDGSYVCTERDCATKKTCEGKYVAGEVYDAADGCNVCLCNADGSSSCTRRACAPPDDTCTSTNDCAPGTLCSVEFGDCLSACPPDAENCPAVCAGTCVPWDESAFCLTSDDCSQDEECSTQYGDCQSACTSNAKGNRKYCLDACAGTCVAAPSTSSSGVVTCSVRALCEDPFTGEYYEVPGCDAAGNVLTDPCADSQANIVQEITEYEDEVEVQEVSESTEGEESSAVETIKYEADIPDYFDDLSAGTLEATAANHLAARGVIGGFPDGTFRPVQLVNRAEAAKFLLLSRYGEVPETDAGDTFLDVAPGEWYVRYVITAARLGVINGYADRTFRPANSVNTAEFLKMLSKTYDLPENMDYTYVDVPDDAWFTPYAGVAQELQLFPGRQTYLQPDMPLNRSEVAIAIYRLLLALQ